MKIKTVKIYSEGKTRLPRKFAPAKFPAIRYILQDCIGYVIYMIVDCFLLHGKPEASQWPVNHPMMLNLLGKYTANVATDVLLLISCTLTHPKGSVS